MVGYDKIDEGDPVDAPEVDGVVEYPLLPEKGKEGEPVGYELKVLFVEYGRLEEALRGRLVKVGTLVVLLKLVVAFADEVQLEAVLLPTKIALTAFTSAIGSTELGLVLKKQLGPTAAGR